MDGHQRHVGGFQVGVIQIRDQRDIFQIVLQRGIVRGLFVFRYRAQKFLHVFQPRLALVGQVALVHILQAGALQHMLHKFADAHVLPGQHQLVHQFAKVADALAWTGGQAFGNIHQRAVQGHVLLGSVAAQLCHGAVADGALGLIDDALQAGVVGRIDDGPQIGHDVLDFFAVIEAQAAVNTVGNARPHQHFLQYAALGVGAVQHGHIAVFPMAAVLLGDAVADPRGLLPLVSGGEEFDGFACGQLRPQGFFHAARVVGDDLIGRVQNIGGAAVVLFQLDDLRVREILLEIQNIADVRAAPAVDALIVVAHHAQVAAVFGDELHQRVLGEVGILILVHMDVLKALPVAFQHRRMIGEQLQRAHQQIVKIQRIGALEPFFVAVVNIVDLLAAEILLALAEPFVRAQQLVLGVADLALQFPDSQHFIVDVEVLEQLLQHSGLVVLVVNGEGTGIAQLIDIPAEDARAHGVEGADPHLFAFFAGQGGDALLHFLGRFIGKGDGQNMPGRYAVVNQIGDPVRQRPGLAAARSRQNQYRAFQRFRRQPLFLVQSVQIHFSLSSTCFIGVSD